METGTYFKGIYNDLVNRLSSFPSDDPSPNIQDCLRGTYQQKFNGVPNGLEHGFVDFVRAGMLAKSHNLPEDVITHLQELALMQFMWDYNNLEGFEKLIQEYHISQEERKRIGLLILNEKQYPCFSFSAKTLNNIDENWASNYGVPFQVKRETGRAKPNIFSRFITWLKNLFKKKAN